MKNKAKSGFTLAEVLITLGIIGVVAALTAPALIQNAGNAKIGPTLQKVKSTIENANEMMLLDNTASNLYAVASNVPAYMELLSGYISGSSYNTTVIHYSSFNPTLTYYGNTTNYKITHFYPFYFSDSITVLFKVNSGGWSEKGSFQGAYIQAVVDINGTDTSPNKLGKDIFEFYMDYNGVLVPHKCKTEKWLQDSDEHYWDTAGSEAQCNEDGVDTGYGCAGSIFDNNLKVIYQ